MAVFRIIEREHIIMRRTEANACLHYHLFHSATLTACSGIELLLEFLVYSLHSELNNKSKAKANSLVGYVKDEERRNSVKTSYWGLRSWVEFYKRRGIFDLLRRQFDFKFQNLNESTLSEANDTWNKCKHDPYLATPEIARRTVNFLNDYLIETDIESDSNNIRQLTMSEASNHWLGKWEKPMADWVRLHRDSPQTAILIYLAPLLDLIIRLLDDRRVGFELKTPLMVAANYVFSSIDLMPESGDNLDASLLMDDGAVLALTMYWLLRQDGFDTSILYDHWPAKDALVGEINDLKTHIWDEHDLLFPDSRLQIGYGLVWKVIARIVDDGPEVLWQNYWKEQSARETRRT